jgi:glycosyltransferase involved in cell wall biosynthesis
MDKQRLKILVLEPYYGGSHKSFIQGLKNVPVHLELMTLPARKWKWRMRLAAPYYAEKLHRDGRRFDRILCSTFVDVPTFRGLSPAWVREVPLLTYFHENQFVYPVQSEDERDFHFSLTNMTTALASDSLAFNSHYNLSSFLNGIDELMKKSPDIKLGSPREIIQAKTRVLPPGIDFSSIDDEKRPQRRRPPVIVWNHRWEHDKNPDIFFRTLFQLDSQGLDFRLIVLGQSYRTSPPVFEEARKRLSHRLLHFGFVRSRRQYAQWLRQGDLAVSTAGHEFFGIAMIEAVRAGCRPVLPGRLSYPELFPEDFLYADKDFFLHLKKEISRKRRLTWKQSRTLTDRFSWDTLAVKFQQWFTDPMVRTAE